MCHISRRLANEPRSVQYAGESEREVSQVFAHASSPCIIFFDELDALVPRRDDTLSESSARVVNTLLTELDGLDARHGVFVLAATNRPDMLDPAMCRPGRLDRLLYVDLPAPDERAEIVRTLIARRRVPLFPPDAADVVVHMVRGDRGEGYSGADLAALVREACASACAGHARGDGWCGRRACGCGWRDGAR